MQSGFNTNIRHRGVLFHVQTEDSGVARPRIATHLFHGGDILASVMGDYGELLAEPQDALAAAVRARMEAQHKAMLKALCAGAHDAVVLERLGPEAYPAPGTTAATGATPADVEPSTEGRDKHAGILAAAPARSQGEGASEPADTAVLPLGEAVFEYLVERARPGKPGAS